MNICRKCQRLSMSGVCTFCTYGGKPAPNARAQAQHAYDAYSYSMNFEAHRRDHGRGFESMFARMQREAASAKWPEPPSKYPDALVMTKDADGVYVYVR